MSTPDLISFHSTVHLLHFLHTLTLSFPFLFSQAQGRTLPAVLLFLETPPHFSLSYEVLYVMMTRVRNARSLRRLPVKSAKDLANKLAKLRPDFSSTRWRALTKKKHTRHTPTPRREFQQRNVPSSSITWHNTRYRAASRRAGPALPRTKKQKATPPHNMQHLPPSGITNLHNACYVCSAVQLLLSAKSFREYMLSSKHDHQLWSTPPLFPSSAGITSFYPPGTSSVLSSLTRQLRDKHASKPVIDTTTNPWKDLLHCLSSNFAPGIQQCCGEFLDRLLEHLDMELSNTPHSLQHLPRNNRILPESVHHFRLRAALENDAFQCGEPARSLFGARSEITTTCLACKQVLSREFMISNTTVCHPPENGTTIDVVSALHRHTNPGGFKKPCD